jgi:hypothetical protein
MKAFIAIAAVLLSVSAAQAASNNTPHALACMKKNGFTHDMWIARRAGTNAQVQSYIACRDGISVKQAKERGKKDGNFNTWDGIRHNGR